LYLHSSIVQTRAYPRTDEGRRSALRWAVTDSTIALTLALFINASILILAAAVLGGWLLLRSEPAIAFAERDWVVLGDVDNLTGDPIFDDSMRHAIRIA
ncbi:divalent metal cation transporter, partial [Mesorhizobium sp. M8A.F.Ca.ET.181.01.1.1]|uniref:divalent metal cation transporter n=1 Tax=Mesorhizobium sp. M8A.F.Ca.ET.181.01.1.1 TaxID=2563963 RepID=UPI001AEE8087